MDGIAPDCSPFIFLFLIDDRVSPLQVIRELKKCIVFVSDILAVDGLLDDFIAPILVEPGMSHDFLLCRRFQQRVGSARNVEVDLREMSYSAWHALYSSPTL